MSTSTLKCAFGSCNADRISGYDGCWLHRYSTNAHKAKQAKKREQREQRKIMHAKKYKKIIHQLELEKNDEYDKIENNIPIISIESISRENIHSNHQEEILTNLAKFFDIEKEKLKEFNDEELLNIHFKIMESTMKDVVRKMFSNIHRKNKFRDYKKYYSLDFDEEYPATKAIYPNEVEMFIHDLSAVFCRIHRGLGKYYYVEKLNKDEPISISGTCNRKFIFIDFNGVKTEKTIEDINLLAKNKYNVRLTYSRMIFKPFPPGTKIINTGQDLNTFKGFKANPVTKLTPEMKLKIQPILNFIRYVICGGDQEWYTWTMNWIYYLVFEPNEKIKVYLLLVGDPNCGKSTFIIWLIKYIIGKTHGGEISSLDSYFTKFNGLSQYLSLAGFHNISSTNSNSKISSLIETNVTEIYQTLEKKRINAVRTKNYTNFIFANNDGIESMYIRKNDCRAAVPPVSNKYADNKNPDNKEYFIQLYACFTRENADIFVSYVKEYHEQFPIDVRKSYNIPYSEKKETMQRHHQKSHISFLEDIENGDVDLYGYVRDLERSHMRNNKYGKISLKGKNKKLYVTNVNFNIIHRQYAKNKGIKENKISSLEELFGSKHPITNLHKVQLLDETKRTNNLVEIPKRYHPIEEDESYYDVKYFQDKVTRMLNKIPYGNISNKIKTAHQCATTIYRNIFEIEA